MKLKAAILVDHLSIQYWQKKALQEAGKNLDFAIILNCLNTNNKKK